MRSSAEHPGNVALSYKKFYQIRKIICRTFSEKFYYDMQMQPVAQWLKFGDTQPAVVVSTQPLLVAAYSDEMDAVVMLSFPEELVARYGLSVGSRLTTSCVYWLGERKGQTAGDIYPGDYFSGQYADFVPVVQLFIGKKDERIRAYEALFDENIWGEVRRMGEEYLQAHPDTVRDGFYYFKK